ncbi:SET domain-containing protein SmydA-8 isoform X2 [Zophobas morio]|uniref:SET domain-containing protein SmydA-8 isoform X2 n=1 Tax=Zophobas morio TaxID=2755281 RepID=UPI003083A169
MPKLCAVCQKNATQACSACCRAFYCSKEHQKDDWKKHKTSCVCYKVTRDDTLGRCVIATRNIRPGEVIMKSPPLLLGPKTVSAPLCLTCHKRLDLATSRYECCKCHWPLCDDQCARHPLHEPECQIFAKANFKPTVKNDNSKQSIYSSIAPLRALLLKMNDPDKFELLMNGQCHLDAHLTTPLYHILKRSLVPFITQLLQVDTNDTEILTICSIFDTNCFEVRDPQGLVNIRGLYPSIALLSHDCRHNTKHTFEGEGFDLVLTATRPIKKGDLITVTYTQTLWGTLERRAHLKISKHFDCLCQRCSDPTEFGTYVGSIVCIRCQDGKTISCDPLDRQADWKCEKCGFLVVSEEIAWRNESLKREVSQLDKADPGSLEEFLDRYKTVLHEKNSFALQVKYALTQMYGNMEGYRLEELSDQLVDRKVQLCEELLDVAEILEPGLSRFRGSLLYDLHEALMAKVKLGRKELEAKALECLKEAGQILETEPDLGPMVKKKMEKLT